MLRDVLPPGVLNVVSGGDGLGALMTGHPVPRKISFTGSIETGKKVAAPAAPDLKRVTLELGGNDPAIVLDDADPTAVAVAIFAGAFNNNGQVCSAIKRVYVPEAMYDEVVDALAVAGQGHKSRRWHRSRIEVGPDQQRTPVRAGEGAGERRAVAGCEGRVGWSSHRSDPAISSSRPFWPG